MSGIHVTRLGYRSCAILITDVDHATMGLGFRVRIYHLAPPGALQLRQQLLARRRLVAQPSQHRPMVAARRLCRPLGARL